MIKNSPKEKLTKSALKKLFHHPDFPRANYYDPEWIVKNEMGTNVLWDTESLTNVLPLKKGMRILDLGGKCCSASR